MTSMITRKAALVAVALLAAPLLAVGTAAASSSTTSSDGAATPVAAAATSGWARFGHFAPDTQAVDVLVDGAPWATDVKFKDVTHYLSLPTGLHRFEIMPTAQPGATPLLDIEAGVPAGGAITVSAVTTRDGLAPQVFDDALTPPPAGQSLVRFIHAAPDVPAVDVQVVSGPVLASDVTYPWATGYQPIVAGTYDVEVKPVGSSDVLLRISSWSITPGAQSSIVIVKGLDGKLDVVPVLDAAAVAVAPVGGVQTDYGQLALPSHRSDLRIAMYLALLLVLAIGATCCSVRFVRSLRTTNAER